MNSKYSRDSRVIQTDLVLPNDTNNHHTLFGGVLMKKMDAVASISARKHARTEVVTASTDSVDFLAPIYPTDSVSLESFVTWTGRTSMEVFVKAIAEDLKVGTKKVAATAFLTFVSQDEYGKPSPVPRIIPETQEETYLHDTGHTRAEYRLRRKKDSLKLAQLIASETN